MSASRKIGRIDTPAARSCLKMAAPGQRARRAHVHRDGHAARHAPARPAESPAAARRAGCPRRSNRHPPAHAWPRTYHPGHAGDEDDVVANVGIRVEEVHRLVPEGWGPGWRAFLLRGRDWWTRGARRPACARDLGDAGLALHGTHLADGGAAFQLLGDDKVVVGTGRHLRQVRDGQHLLPGRAPNCFISRPTVSATAPPMPTSISSKIRVCGPWAADWVVVTAMASAGARARRRRPPGQRARRAAGMASHQELGALQAPGLGFGFGVQGNLEAATGHAELLHASRDGLRQARRCGGAGA